MKEKVLAGSLTVVTSAIFFELALVGARSVYRDVEYCYLKAKYKPQVKKGLFGRKKVVYNA